MKSLWKLREHLYGDERTIAAFESRTPFDFTERHSLTEICKRVTHGIIWSQTGHQGRTLPTNA
jgi:peptidoglycan hydrolase-like amidase